MFAYFLRLEKWMGGGHSDEQRIKGDVQWRQCNVPRFLYLLQFERRKIPAID